MIPEALNLYCHSFIWFNGDGRCWTVGQCPSLGTMCKLFLPSKVYHGYLTAVLWVSQLNHEEELQTVSHKFLITLGHIDVFWLPGELTRYLKVDLSGKDVLLVHGLLRCLVYVGFNDLLKWLQAPKLLL